MTGTILGKQYYISFDGLQILFEGKWHSMLFDANQMTPVIKTKMYGTISVSIKKQS